MEFFEDKYQEMLEELFVRFPSFQTVGTKAYKPGLENMQFFDQLLGHPHRKYKTIHIAGTDGKGSVSNMLASVLGARGLKVGLYTSPHILDFRERMRFLDGQKTGTGEASAMAVGTEAGLPCGMTQLIPKESVYEFITRWSETFEHLGLSFFEITTMMAFDWFAQEKVDIAVIETGLGGRLDSTNIITPELAVITNIGLDHCDILGSALSEIAFEKAGIIKPKIPVVVGESNAETDPVFERKVLYTNLSEPDFMGDRTKIMSLLTFADKVEPGLWDRHEEILKNMDLQGEYQRKNLRTVLAAIDVLQARLSSAHGGAAGETGPDAPAGKASFSESLTVEAIEHTAERMGFHGRWEKLLDNPLIIADIGHNAHGLKYNFSQLGKLKTEGGYDALLMVFGMVADKDIRAVLELLPDDAEYFFTNASGKRALPAAELEKEYSDVADGAGRKPGRTAAYGSVAGALAGALSRAEGRKALIYIGGSTYVVAEAVEALKLR